MKTIYIFLLSSFLNCLLSTTIFALKVRIPSENERDIVAKDEIITRSESKDSLLNAIRFINSYLRFFIAALCMGVVIYAGFKIMSSRGDDGEVKKGVNMLVYAGIGIGVALLAYAIVNVIVNFFGSG